MQISIKRKNVYGNELIYPCNMIQELQSLTGRRVIALTPGDS